MNTLFLSKRFQNIFGNDSRYIFVSIDEINVSKPKNETSLEVFDYDRAKIYLNDYTQALIRWKTETANEYYFNFLSIKSIENIYYYLLGHDITNCVFPTGIPHHFDTINWSVACRLAGVRQFYFVPNIITDGHFFVEQYGAPTERKVIKIGNLERNLQLLTDIEENLSALANFQPPRGAASMSILNRSKWYTYILILKNMLKYIIKFRNTADNKDYSFGVAQYNLISEFRLVHNQNIYLKLYENECIKKSEPLSGNSIIYFAHYQPEANTDPETGVYSNQLRNIDWLKHKFPNKKIYYKEHPGCWNFNGQRIGLSRVGLCRNKQFFDYLKDKVVFLDRDYHIDEKYHYDESILFASINGTVGLQRSLHGLNTLFFANVWFDQIGTIYKSETYDLLDRKLLEIGTADINKQKIVDFICAARVHIGLSIGMNEPGECSSDNADVQQIKAFLANTNKMR